MNYLDLNRWFYAFYLILSEPQFYYQKLTFFQHSPLFREKGLDPCSGSKPIIVKFAGITSTLPQRLPPQELS